MGEDTWEEQVKEKRGEESKKGYEGKKIRMREEGEAEDRRGRGVEEIKEEKRKNEGKSIEGKGKEKTRN